jgi:glucose-6-phosphate-specific signal transduction histidine kinase
VNKWFRNQDKNQPGGSSSGGSQSAQNIAEADQLTIAELENRLSIAQDISELVIQNISAVISRAEGGIYAAKSSPESAVRSLERVLENAQSANNEVRRLNDLLRQHRDVSVAPPDLSDLEPLAIRYRSQGFNCSYSNEGKAFALNQGAQLAVYRIAFEALRYFAESAPKGSTLSIDLIWSENGLQVLIKDNSVSVANRNETATEGVDAQYSVQDDLKALVQPIDNQVISACRARASIYGGSADLTEVPGVGQTLSAYFPDLRLIASDTTI